MSAFFEDTMHGLLEATEIERGNTHLTERTDMPAKTFCVAENDVNDKYLGEEGEIL